MKIHLKILTFTNEVQNAKSTEIVHLSFFSLFKSVLIMIDYTVNYWSGFYHIMQCCRMTEVCWNNNKANVFPVQTDTPLMGCQTNFLLSESCRQPNRCSDHDSSLLWALRGNIHIPNYHPLRPMIIYRHKKKKNHKFASLWGKMCFIGYMCPHMFKADPSLPRRVTSGNI